MREIKFRVWDKERKLMVGTDYPDNWGCDYTTYFEDCVKIDLTGIEDLNKDAWFDVMQFTGLEDKNGKPIYEGDIVKNHGCYCLYLIVWKGTGLWFQQQNSNKQLFNWNCTNGSFEVLGNIHENPELLGGE